MTEEIIQNTNTEETDSSQQETKLLYPYTRMAYAVFSNEASLKGQRIEVVDKYAAFALYDYEVLQGERVVNVSETEEYKTQKLNEAKLQKYRDIEEARLNKIEGKGSTITINMPAVLKKGNEVKQVENYKLLVNTTNGSLDTVLSALKDIPVALLTDVLVDYQGWTVVGLANKVQYQGEEAPQIYLIWLSAFMAKAAITEYVRQLNDAILAATSIEEVNAIVFDFEQF